MPLPTIQLGASGIQTTPLGFGCASLFSDSDRKQRAGLLHAAYDCGVRHFDVAPMYGLGRAETELGAFTRQHRADVTITTKFGIEATRAARYLSYAQRPARRILAARPAWRDRARASVGAAAHRVYDTGSYHACGAKHSLERSLRALRTDYIDVFLLHDPAPGSVRSDEVAAYLDGACRAGMVRAWGVAGEPGPADDVARSFPHHHPVRQFRDDILIRAARHAPPGSAFITYGVIDRPLIRLMSYLSADAQVRERWATTIGDDCGEPEVAASFLLQAALRANSSGVVLFSTSHPARIAAAVKAHDRLSSPDQAGLQAFERLVGLELTEPRTPERRPV